LKSSLNGKELIVIDESSMLEIVEKLEECLRVSASGIPGADLEDIVFCLLAILLSVLLSGAGHRFIPIASSVT
jgi:hypothetical protein